MSVHYSALQMSALPRPARTPKDSRGLFTFLGQKRKRLRSLRNAKPAASQQALDAYITTADIHLQQQPSVQKAHGKQARGWDVCTCNALLVDNRESADAGQRQILERLSAQHGCIQETHMALFQRQLPALCQHDTSLPSFTAAKNGSGHSRSAVQLGSIPPHRRMLRSLRSEFVMAKTSALLDMAEKWIELTY